MKLVRISEYDQTIVAATPLDGFSPPNDFLRDLVVEAAACGTATRPDAEGCPVTAIVWDDSDPSQFAGRTTMVLDKGKKYDLDDLHLIGWTVGDGSGHEGYHVGDYFDGDDCYLGPDQHGIEPIFGAREIADGYIADEILGRMRPGETAEQCLRRLAAETTDPLVREAFNQIVRNL